MNSKAIFLITILLLKFNFILSQQFFSPENLENEEERFGYSLIQSKIDTTYEFREEIEYSFEKEVVEFYDTLFFDDFWIVNTVDNLNQLLRFGDTSIISRKLRDEKEFLFMPMSYSQKQSEHILSKSSSFKEWECINDNEITKSENWKLGNRDSVYQVFTKWVVPIPFGNTTYIVPELILDKILFKPKTNLNTYQKDLLEKDCSKFLLYKNYRLRALKDYKRVYCYMDIKETLINEAKFDLVELINYNYLEDHVKKIKTILGEEKLFKGKIDNKIDDRFKAAIINYQLKFELPIGQFDKKTINHILRN